MGEGEILPTPTGLILKKLIESGCRIGISSRGVGNGQTNNEGVLVIGESYKLITFDAVADPSTYAAYQSRVTGKRETVEPANTFRPYVHSPEPSQMAEEKTKQFNHRALVSYFGTMLSEEVKQIKDKLRKTK